MTDILSLIALAILTENVILARFLGTCPFLGVSTKRSSAVGMGLAVTLVIGISSVVSWLVNEYVLEPFEMVFMRTIVYIFIIASLVQIIEMFMKKVVPSLYRSLGIYLPLITTNCAVLGLATIVTGGTYNFLEATIYSFASGFGFLFVIFIFSTIRERIEHSPIPNAFKGVPIALITAGIMAMLFARFAGIA